MEIKSVPPLDLKRQYAPLREQVRAAFDRVFDSEHFILGPDVAQFEREMAEWSGAREVIGVTSGTDAIWLALKAAGIRPGDQVLTSSFTFFGTISALVNAGAVPVFADVDPVTGNLDPAKVEAVLAADSQRRIRALLPVHIFGQMADMRALGTLADKYGIRLIEDAAQAVGATYEGKAAGTWGHLGCFSLYPTKNLGAVGDAGYLTVSDSDLADRVKLLRVHGSKTRYVHETVGGNFRMDTVQAAVLRVFLPHLKEWIALRQKAAAYYDRKLANLDSRVGIPGRAEKATHVFHQYTLQISGGQRDGVQKALTERKIGNAVYYPIPCHLQQAIAEFGFKKGMLPVTERLADEVLSIPIFPGITEAEQDYVVDAIDHFLKGRH